MSEGRDLVLAYALWAKDGRIIQQSSLALLNSSIDSLTIMSRLKEYAGLETGVDWSQVLCVSYDILEATGKGYNRYNGWIDQSELADAEETMSAVATLSEETALTSNPAEIISEVEEILREER
ncbi:MAG TPA: hypothetical protein VH186_20660 [Chloroflexia bacterium]|nr:hypothetical protein [Chloroflexia bacterium]